MFICPISGDNGIDYWISQWYGQKALDYEQFGLMFHNGIDFAVKAGTTVYAPHDGFVRLGNEGKKGYGMYAQVISDPAGHYEERYRSDLAHLSFFLVAQGTFVRAGDPVARSGNTGFSTADHLHWTLKKLTKNMETLNYGNGVKGAIDPSRYTLPNLPERTLRP